MGLVLAIGLAVLASLFGAGLGYFVKSWQARGTKIQMQALESQLNASRDELVNYRQEVFQQLSDTADKFRNLDQSYHALHRQLATSAAMLCGDQATSLLAGDVEPLLTQDERVEQSEEINDQEEIEIVVSETGTSASEIAEADVAQALTETNSAPSAATEQPEEVPILTDADESQGQNAPGESAEGKGRYVG